MADNKWVSNGIVAGVVSGIFFAFYLILTEMTETLGGFIGLPTQIGGLLVNVAMSILAGVIFAFLLGKLVRSWWSAIFIGLLFGFVVWLIGPMTLLSTITAGELLFSQWNRAGLEANIPLLFGHLLYGLILGLGYCFLKKGKLHKLKKPIIR